MKKGFTLIEMLVVVAVIAFILSFVAVSTLEARRRGRDARREEDIKQIQNILDIYHVNKRQYPVCEETVINGLSDCLTSELVSDDLTSATPVDPLGRSSGECLAAGSYVYCYESGGDDYILRYNLETNSIPGKSAGWQSVSP